MRDDCGDMNNLNQCSDKSGPPDILKDLNISAEPSAPCKDVFSDDDDVKAYNVTTEVYTDSQLEDFYTARKAYAAYNTRAPGVLVEIQDIKEKEKKRRRIRQIKKTVGILGWLLCAPLMLTGLCIRDKPDVNEDDEWKDDVCMPCYYDVDFRYPGER